VNASGEAHPETSGEWLASVGPGAIDPAQWYRQALGPESGAVVQFCGLVRNHNRGALVLSLEYEAYTEMAEAVLREIMSEARDLWSFRSVSVVHRTGRLELGDVAVCVTVASDHRREALEACGYIMDHLKVRAPIWKREWLQSGERRWLEEGRPEPRGGR
jgi:molybdopterin synthase catalytic subunit